MDVIQAKRPAQIKVIFEGSDYILSKPNLSQAREFRKKLKEVEGDSDAHESVLLDFLEHQGLPKSVVEMMDMECLAQVAEALSGKKKS